MKPVLLKCIARNWIAHVVARIYAAFVVLFLLVTTALSPFHPAYAAGFALKEMSAGGVGNAHAGSAALAEDLSTIYSNPAGLTRLPGQQIMIAGSAIRPSAKFSNMGSVSAFGALLTGGDGGDAGTWGFVPALYYAAALTPRLHFGLGVQAPFGLATDYDAGWVGRYQALRSELRTVDINPAFAYRFNDRLSLGGGVSVQYADVEISRAIDFGGVCVAALGAGVCGPIGFLPQTQDGHVEVGGKNWSYGYNLGLLLTVHPAARLGLSYRSKVHHELSGDATFTTPAGLPAPIASSPVFANTSAKASVTLPESVGISGYVDLDSTWSLMGGVNWTRWSRFKELRIRFDNGAPDSVTTENWRNTYRVSLAANYRCNHQWKLRGGIAYDQSPVPDSLRTARIPDADRLWLALGTQYKPSSGATWDIGYALLMVKDASIDNADPPFGGRLIGRYKSDVNIFSVQYSQAF